MKLEVVVLACFVSATLGFVGGAEFIMYLLIRDINKNKKNFKEES